MGYPLTLALLGGILIVGFYFGLIARRIRLPSLIGYMFLGVMLGPTLAHVFGVACFDEAKLNRLAFITEICLGFVAFNIGAELSIASLKRLGSGIVSIILAESFGALGLILGFQTRLCAMGIILVMLGAIFMVHIKFGFFMNWFGFQAGEH